MEPLNNDERLRIALATLQSVRKNLDHLQGESEVAIAVCNDIDATLARISA